MSGGTVRIESQPDGSYLLDVDGETHCCPNLDTVITVLRRKEDPDGQNQRPEGQGQEL